MMSRATKRSRRNPTVIPRERVDGFTTYYEIDPDDRPSLRAISDAWSRGVKPYDADVNGYWPLRELMRVAKPGNFLRDMPGTKEFRDLVASIRRDGVLEPLIVIFDRVGEIRVGEGNHRIAALLEIYPTGHRDGIMVPLRLIFHDSPHVAPWGGWPTWATFRRPDLYYRPADDPRHGHSAKKRPRRERPPVRQALPPRTPEELARLAKQTAEFDEWARQHPVQPLTPEERARYEHDREETSDEKLDRLMMEIFGSRRNHRRRR